MSRMIDEVVHNRRDVCVGVKNGCNAMQAVLTARVPVMDCQCRVRIRMKESY
jgi:hypothetical protein